MSTDGQPIPINNEVAEKIQAENYTAINTQSKHINFALDVVGDSVKEPSTQKQSLKLNRSPTPYPKQLKQMAKNLKAGSKSSSNSVRFSACFNVLQNMTYC